MRSALRAVSVLLLYASVSYGGVLACSADGELKEFVSSHYGERIEFDVLRNGKVVGEHVTTFTPRGNLLSVSSRMSIDISVLFVPLYSFDYQSESEWCGSRMLELVAVTHDGGETSETRARSDGQDMLITYADGKVVANATLLPTDHWNPAVLQRNEVLNTITGQVNNVAIDACANPSSLLTRHLPYARCFEYSGDLQARAWYDQNTRWVGLEFEGRDGSEIIYRCRTCAVTGKAL